MCGVWIINICTLVSSAGLTSHTHLSLSSFARTASFYPTSHKFAPSRSNASPRNLHSLSINTSLCFYLCETMAVGVTLPLTLPAGIGMLMVGSQVRVQCANGVLWYVPLPAPDCILPVLPWLSSYGHHLTSRLFRRRQPRSK